MKKLVLKRVVRMGLALAIGALFSSGVFVAQGWAQNNARTSTPDLPEPLKNMAAEGAQMRYLGREGGLDGWIAIQGGQEQYFYVTPDRESFVMGLQFDKTGRIITLGQVQSLQAQGDPVLDRLTGTLDRAVETTAEAPRAGIAAEPGLRTPAEQLYEDVKNTNWVPVGQEGAPVLYAFIDPQCPHCKSFLNDVRPDYIPNGKVQLRVIPVGFRDETMAQSAFLLAAPDPATALFAFMDGDQAALPGDMSLNQQGVQRNLAVMQSWKLNATPMMIYRARDGQVKIVQGRANDVRALIADLER